MKNDDSDEEWGTTSAQAAAAKAKAAQRAKQPEGRMLSVEVSIPLL